MYIYVYDVNLSIKKHMPIHTHSLYIIHRSHSIHFGVSFSQNIHFDIPSRVCTTLENKKNVSSFAKFHMSVKRWTKGTTRERRKKNVHSTPQKHNILLFWPNKCRQKSLCCHCHTIFLYGFPNFIDCITFDGILMEWVSVSNIFFFADFPLSLPHLTVLFISFFYRNRCIRFSHFLLFTFFIFNRKVAKSKSYFSSCSLCSMFWFYYRNAPVAM